jgi:hypothetical protein
MQASVYAMDNGLYYPDKNDEKKQNYDRSTVSQ